MFLVTKGVSKNKRGSHMEVSGISGGRAGMANNLIEEMGIEAKLKETQGEKVSDIVSNMLRLLREMASGGKPTHSSLILLMGHIGKLQSMGIDVSDLMDMVQDLIQELLDSDVDLSEHEISDEELKEFMTEFIQELMQIMLTQAFDV